MSAKELVQRMLCSQARIDSQKLRTGRLDENDWRKLHKAVNQLAEAPIFIDDNAGITIMELRSKIRRLKSKYDLGMVIIDYIQLMSYDRRMENRQQEIAAISRSLKIVGRDFNIPVIAVSQLSREPEKRRGGDRRPILSDLRESGAIEQDADLIIFIYREELYEPDNDDVKGLAELIIAKHRHGPTGMVKLTFQSDYARFQSMPYSSIRE
jgi:replicative DNA helicase